MDVFRKRDLGKSTVSLIVPKAAGTKKKTQKMSVSAPKMAKSVSDP